MACFTKKTIQMKDVIFSLMYAFNRRYLEVDEILGFYSYLRDKLECDNEVFKYTMTVTVDEAYLAHKINVVQDLTGLAITPKFLPCKRYIYIENMALTPESYVSRNEMDETIFNYMKSYVELEKIKDEE